METFQRRYKIVSFSFCHLTPPHCCLFCFPTCIQHGLQISYLHLVNDFSQSFVQCLWIMNEIHTQFYPLNSCPLHNELKLATKSSNFYIYKLRWEGWASTQGGKKAKLFWLLNYGAFSIASMHSNTVILFDIAFIRASWRTLLFFRRDPANRTCISFSTISILNVFLMCAYHFHHTKNSLTAHLVRFSCWSLLSCGLLLFINLCRKR